MPSSVHAGVLALGLFAVTFAVNLPAPLYGAYAGQSGAGAAAVTLAFAAYVAGLMPTLVLLGGLSDRVGRRGPVAVALVLAALSMLLLTLVPSLPSLVAARILLGVGTGLATTAGTAWMTEILGGDRSRNAALLVTSATSLGFGGGALATGVTLALQGETFFPASYAVFLVAAPLLAVAVRLLPAAMTPGAVSILRLPVFPEGTWICGAAMALAWSATGMTIAVVPLELDQRGLGGWTGLVIFLAIFTGFLCQPLARRMANRDALMLGFVLVPLGFLVLLAGVWANLLALVLAGACITSAASYGFSYLASLARIASSSAADRARATAGLFVYAYAGFSLPVIASGIAADAVGGLPAMAGFAAFLSGVTAAVVGVWLRRLRAASRQARQAPSATAPASVSSSAGK